MNIKKYFLLASVGLMAVACQDKIGNEPKPSGKEGDEVVFGATLDESPESRTIYGDETSSGFPIKWLGDDQMIVASPQGCVGRNMADYGVDPTVLPNPTSQSAYAGTLVKKGDTGVQWGTSETADFYSIYPQLTDEVKFGEDSKTTTTNCTSFNIKVQEQQTCLVSTGTEPKMTTADMYACYMYAKTTGVKKGDPVNLKYVPFSTAIRFRLSAPTDGSAVTISNITLTSPNPIAGKYTVDLTSVTADIKYPAVTAGSDAVKSVSIFAEYEGGSGGYITLSNDQSVELNAFIMLDSSKDAGGDDKYTYDISKGWSLSVVVNGKKQTLSLDGTVPEGGSGILTAGKVHRLPKLPPLKSEEWKAANWLVNVPRNVYLSEVSIPGSWNSLNEDFQGKNVTSDWQKAITDQYNVGCRAFHIDTRWKGDNTHGISNYFYRYLGPKSGNPSTWNSDVNNLSVANGQDAWQVHYRYYSTAAPVDYDTSVQDGKIMDKDKPLFTDILNTIVSKVQPDEYMVVICTFAQNSFQHTPEWHGFKSWMQAISDACNSIANKDNIADGRNITNKTTVGDVLGKVIVIVNCEGDVPGIAETHRPSNSKCLFVNAPLTLNSNMFGSTSTGNNGYYYNFTSGPSIKDFSLMNIQAQISSSANSGFNTTARGYAPTLNERQTVGKNILKNSWTNFTSKANAHDKWYYQGLGGYTQPSATGSEGGHANVAETMNNWIGGIIDNMQAAPPTGGFATDPKIGPGNENDKTVYFPVGIVLMNFVTNTTYGKPNVEKIWKLNSLYRLNYDASRPAWPKQSSSNSIVKKGGNAMTWE